MVRNVALKCIKTSTHSAVDAVSLFREILTNRRCSSKRQEMKRKRP